MNTVTTKAMAKVAAVATGLAMATSMLSLAPMAHAAALTSAQVQSILSLLSSFGADSTTIANVQASLTGTAPVMTGTGGSMSSSCSFSRNLTIGSTGADVKCLQAALIGGGFPLQAGATGYFGTQTRAAVASWQSSKNIAPAVGYFGSVSRAAFNLGGGSTGGTSGGTTGGTVGAGTGTGLKVMVAATSPNGSVLVATQGIGDIAEFSFANPTAAPINVTGLTFKRIGVSNDSTMTNVYLYNGVNRLTDSAGVSNAQFSFTSATGLFTVPAGGVYTVAVRSDISSGSSGQQIGASLVSVASTGTLDSSVSFPINSGYQTISAATIAAVAFNATTIPTGTPSISPQNDYPVWQNTIAVSANPVWLKSMKFTNLGSTGSSNLINLRLMVDGTQAGTAVASLSSDRSVTFDLSAAPVMLSTQSHVVKVLANVVGGASLTFAFSVQRSSDAMFVDSQLGQPVTPTSNGGTNYSAVTAGTVTINSVSASSGVSVTKGPSSPVSDVAVGATNVKLAAFDMLPSGENVKVMDLYVYATTAGTNSGTGLNNGKVYFNGVQVGSTKDIGEGTANATDFSMGSSLILPAGVTSHVDIYADAQNAAGTNLSTGATALITLKYVASNAQGVDSLTSTAVPATNTSGNSITVTSSSLTATKASGYANQTLLAGTTHALLGSFTISAGSTEGLAVNTVNFDLAGAAGVSNLMLADHATGSATGLGSTLSTPATTNNSFSVNFTLPTSGTKTIDIYGDILSGATTAIQATLNTTTSSTGSSGTTASLAGTQALQTITVGAGQLYAVRGAANPLSAVVIAGNASPVKVATFAFSAVNSPFTVQKLLVKVPANAATAVNNVTLSYKDSSNVTQTVTQTLALSSGAQTYATATFTGLSFYVPNNASSDLTVSVTTPTIASGGAAISGAAISAVLDYNEGFQAIDGSGAATTTPGFITSDVNGASGSYGTSILRKTTLVFAGLSSSLTQKPTSGNDIFRFTATADAAGPADLYKVTVNVATTSLTVTSFNIYDAADTSTALNASALNPDSNGNITFTLSTPSAGYVAIAAGSTKTFVVRATTIGTWGSGSSISTRFGTADSASTPNAAAASVASTPLFVWSDESANNHSVTTTDWTNGYLLKNLTDGVYSYVSGF